MARRGQVPVAVVVVAVLLTGCGGSGGAAAADPDPNNQVQVATSEQAREDTANVSTRLKEAGYDVIGSAPAGAGPGGFAVTLDDGGLVIILVLDSDTQAAAVEQGFRQSGSDDALVQRHGTHVYAANTLGASASRTITRDEFDRLVAAGEGT